MQNKFHVTLAKLRKAKACYTGYNKVVMAIQGKEFTHDDACRESYIRLAHKEPISILSIIDSNGLDDALWALRCIENADKDKDVRLFAVWCARQVGRLMTNQCSKDVLDVAERHANGQASDGELDAAKDAAKDAAWDAAKDAARDAAKDAAWDAAWAAAWAAAKDAAWDAARAAAWAAARAAAWVAAWDAAWDAQEKKLRQMLDLGYFTNDEVK